METNLVKFKKQLRLFSLNGMSYDFAYIHMPRLLTFTDTKGVFKKIF